jgi:hypothetical protein
MMFREILSNISFGVSGAVPATKVEAMEELLNAGV